MATDTEPTESGDIATSGSVNPSAKPEPGNSAPQLVKVGELNGFMARPETGEVAAIGYVKVGDREYVAPTEPIPVKPGDKIVIHGLDGFYYYNQFAVVTKPGTPPRSLSQEQVKHVGEDIILSLPSNTYSDGTTLFLVCSSTFDGVTPILLGDAFVAKTTNEEEDSESEVSEDEDKAQREQFRRVEGNQDNSSSEGKDPDGRLLDGQASDFIGRVQEGSIGGLVNAATQGISAHPAASKETTNKTNATDTREATQASQKKWRRDYIESSNVPSSARSANIQEEVTENAEVSPEMQFSGEVSGEATVSVDSAPSTQSEPISTDVTVTQPSEARSVSVEASVPVSSGDAQEQVRAQAVIEPAVEIQEAIGRTTTVSQQVGVSGQPTKPAVEASVNSVQVSGGQNIKSEVSARVAGAEQFKIYEKPEQDPSLSPVLEARAAVQADPKNLEAQSKLTESLQTFVNTYPEKAQAYESQIPEMKSVMQNRSPEQPEAVNESVQTPIEEPTRPQSAESDIEKKQGKTQKKADPKRSEFEGLVNRLRIRGKGIDSLSSNKLRTGSAGGKESGAVSAAPSPQRVTRSESDFADQGEKSTVSSPDAAELENPAEQAIEGIPNGEPRDVETIRPPLAAMPERLSGQTPELPRQQPGQQSPGSATNQPPEVPNDEKNVEPALEPLQQMPSKASKAVDEALSAPGISTAQKAVVADAFWWLVGFSWLVFPILVLNIYWILFHTRNKKLFPFSILQKVVTLLLDACVALVFVLIIAFVIKGCESLFAQYGMSLVGLERMCDIADAFKHGGVMTGLRETAGLNNTPIQPGGPASVSQWNQKIIQAANANGLPNSCILQTMVAKESGGNKNAVSTSCPSQESMKNYKLEQQSPPLYNLNWNCGHAIGLTQIYIFPNTGSNRWQDVSTPSRFLFNQYHTIPQLADPDYNLNLGAKYFAYLLSRNTNINLSSYARSLPADEQKIWKAFRQYNGSGAEAEGYADDSMHRYALCALTGR